MITARVSMQANPNDTLTIIINSQIYNFKMGSYVNDIVNQTIMAVNVTHIFLLSFIVGYYLDINMLLPADSLP